MRSTPRLSSVQPSAARLSRRGNSLPPAVTWPCAARARRYVSAHVGRPVNGAERGPEPLHLRGHAMLFVDTAHRPLAAIDREILPPIYGRPEPRWPHGEGHSVPLPYRQAPALLLGRPNVFTANASAAFASEASIVPRLWARDRRMETRQRRSSAAVGFFFGDFIPLEIAAAGADCESASSSFGNPMLPLCWRRPRPTHPL